MIEVTLEKGNTSLFTKKFKKENTLPERETKFQPQTDIASKFWNKGWRAQ